MKRLGKLNGALSDLDISSKILVSQPEKWDKVQSRKSMIQECIGDTYLIKRDYRNALIYFNKAEVLNQEDIEVKYNLLECYCKVNSETEIENMLRKIADMNATVPKNREELLFDLLRRNNKPIKDLVKYII